MGLTRHNLSLSRCFIPVRTVLIFPCSSAIKRSVINLQYILHKTFFHGLAKSIQYCIGQVTFWSCLSFIHGTTTPSWLNNLFQLSFKPYFSYDLHWVNIFDRRSKVGQRSIELLSRMTDFFMLSEVFLSDGWKITAKDLIGLTVSSKSSCSQLPYFPTYVFVLYFLGIKEGW